MSRETSGKKNVGVAVILAWLLPGCGHFYLGRRGKAVIFLVAVIGAFVYGMCLGDFQNVNPHRYDKQFLAQVFSGLPAVTGYVIARYDTRVVDEGPQIFDVSSVYTCVAGLLNLLVILDAGFLAAKGGK